MATTAKKPANRGFRQRRSQSPPPPETELVDEAPAQEEDVVETPAASPAKAPAKKPAVAKTEPIEKPLQQTGDHARVGEGRSDASDQVSPLTLGTPDDEIMMMGFSTTMDLWKSYKSLQNHTALEGRTIKIAEITRAVIAKELPSSYTDEGLVRARKYGEDWTRKRAAGSATRTTRQLHLPVSTVKELRRLSMVLEDRGYRVSTSAIVSGILDENLPAQASVKKLVES